MFVKPDGLHCSRQTEKMALSMHFSFRPRGVSHHLSLLSNETLTHTHKMNKTSRCQETWCYIMMHHAFVPINSKWIMVRNTLNISTTQSETQPKSDACVSLCEYVRACCIFLRKIWNKHCNISMVFIRWEMEGEGGSQLRSLFLSLIHCLLPLLSITFHSSVCVCGCVCVCSHV